MNNRVSVFLTGIGLFSILTGCHQDDDACHHEVDAAPPKPLEISIDPPVRYDRSVEGKQRTSHGDTFYAAWLPDDRLFVLTDDTKGFDWELKALAPGNKNAGRNLTVNELVGTPWNGDLLGHAIKGEHDALAYFRGENEGPENLPAGGVWKGASIACYDGVLYLSVNDQTQNFPDKRVRATGASILKSDDAGRNWSRPGQAANTAPLPFMFTDRHFTRLNFITYGRDGSAKGNPDDCEQWVYASSNDVEWDNGDHLYLGRVARADLPKLRASDWQFLTGFRDKKPVWGDLKDIAPIVTNQGKLSQTEIFYFAPLKKYFFVTSYYVRRAGLTPKDDAWYGGPSSHHTRWEVYAADHPWGPWEGPLCEREFDGTGYYTPAAPAKFMRDGEVWLLSSGDYWNTKLYGLSWMRMTIR
jgi:hypothetical protein